MHRTQLYLEDDQYRWLKLQAGRRGSIAGVVRDLIDAARSERADPETDPALRYLLVEPPGRGRPGSTVESLDAELYGG